METPGPLLLESALWQCAQLSYSLTLLFGFAFAGEALGGRTDDSLLWSTGESILKVCLFCWPPPVGNSVIIAAHNKEERPAGNSCTGTGNVSTVPLGATPEQLASHYS